jgi:hypothetical protein
VAWDRAQFVVVQKAGISMFTSRRGGRGGLLEQLSNFVTRVA